MAYKSKESKSKIRKTATKVAKANIQKRRK